MLVAWRERCVVLALVFAVAGPAAAQVAQFDLERARIMARGIKDELHRHYYDSTFHGVDIDAQLDSASARFATARSNSEVFALLARALWSLNDSHTIFWAPDRQTEVHYGFRLDMVGDTCFVAAIDPESDAWHQGIRTGDRIIAVDRYAVNRPDFWKFEYTLRTLAPRTATTLRVSPPGGQVREVTVASRTRTWRSVLDFTQPSFDYWQYVREEQNWEHDHRNEFVTVDGKTTVWRMPTFAIRDDDVDHAIDQVRHADQLVLDLRGNQGGYVRAIDRLLSRLLTENTVIDTTRERKKVEIDTVKVRGDRFTGPIAVLVDSRSASAAEITAATLQRLRHAAVLGDISSGAVMESMGYGEQAGGAITVFYGLSVTIADVILADGTHLEHHGVTPDERVLPTGADLANKRDPALARALQRLGHTTTPEQAGRLYTADVHTRDLW